MELQYPWCAYAPFQDQLAHRCHVDDYSWGLEAGLNRLLDKPLELPAQEHVTRAIRSEGRKERYRKQLLRIWLAGEESTETDRLDDVIDARQLLRQVEAHTTEEDWALLRTFGEGHTYEEIAAATKIAAGTLRARVLRLRRTLVGCLSEPRRNARRFRHP